MNGRTNPGSGGAKVGFVFTNFNNSRFTIQAVQSIFGAADADRCELVVVDNCSVPAEVAMLAEAKAISPRVHVIENPENVGYFPGLNIGIDFLRAHYPDIELMVIGNNDLVFGPDFIVSLDRQQALFAQYPVVSPDLITLDQVHQNPHVLSEVSRFREIVWDIYFSNFFLAKLIKKAAAVSRPLTERQDYKSYTTGGLIYQGYGACYILTPVFFREFGRLWAPAFLMGEEFYLAKQLESKGYRYYYEPGIIVQHHDHATVSKIPSRKLWEFTREYHRIYRRFISPYRLEMDKKLDYRELN